MAAPETTAPVESLTVPEMLPPTPASARVVENARAKKQIRGVNQSCVLRFIDDPFKVVEHAVGYFSCNQSQKIRWIDTPPNRSSYQLQLDCICPTSTMVLNVPVNRQAPDKDSVALLLRPIANSS